MHRNKRHQIQILNYLNKNSSADIFRLTSQLGLSDSTLSRVMRDMVARGLVEAYETNNDGPGRPAQIYRINPSLTYAVGVELTTTVIRWVVINAIGEVLHQNEYPIQLPNDNESFLVLIE